MVVLTTSLSSRARKWLAGTAWLLVVAWAVAGGCGSGGPTRGTQCTQVLEAACNKLGGTTCQVFPPNQIGSCISAGVTTCCAGDCSASVISTQSQIDTCVAAINADTCAQLNITSGGTLPASCVGVVRSALGSATSALSAEGEASPGARIGGLVSQ
jgi:hypothetical protein